MSLLGIIIDKSLASERLENKALGYVEGTTDERLLKELGVLALEKGTWKLKYKGEEVAELLNWIASGKPKGTLPSLAKRILCLKREKLLRGIKDAGTSTFSRSTENIYVAEIDAIFASVGDKVGCGAFGTQQARPSKPGGTPKPPASGAGPSSGPPTGPPGPPRSPEQNVPAGQGPSVPGSVGTTDPRAPSPAPVTPGLPAGQEPIVAVSVRTTDPDAPSQLPEVPAGPQPNPQPVAVDPAAARPAPVPEGPVPEGPVPERPAPAGGNNANANAVRRFKKQWVPAFLDVLDQLPDSPNRTSLEQVFMALMRRHTAPGFAQLLTEVEAILSSERSDEEKAQDLLALLGQPLHEEILGTLQIQPPNPILPLDRQIETAVNAAVEKRLDTRRSCSDKIQCLQQLVYTTCGEASLLDPLLDHLHKLLAAFSSLPEKNSRITTLQETLGNLESYIQKMASSSIMNSNRSNLKTQLSTLEAQLSALNSPPNSPMTGKTADMEATAQEKAKRRVALTAEINKLRDLLTAQQDPEARREMLRSQLFEEQELLDSLLRILPDADPFFAVATGYKSDVVQQLRAIDSANIKTLDGACNARSFAYRQQLMNAREEVDRLKEEELERMRKKYEEERMALVSNKDEKISELERRLAELESQRASEYETQNAELKKLRNEKSRLEESLRSSNERASSASQSKTNVETKLSTYEATIASLKAQLAEASKPSAPIQPPSAPSVTNTRVNEDPQAPVPIAPTPSAPVVPATQGSVKNRIRALSGAPAPKFVSHRGPGFRGGSLRRQIKSARITRKLRQ